MIKHSYTVDTKCDPTGAMFYNTPECCEGKDCDFDEKVSEYSTSIGELSIGTVSPFTISINTGGPPMLIPYLFCLRYEGEDEINLPN